MSIFNSTEPGAGPEGLKAFDAYSEKNTENKYDAADVIDRWNTYAKSPADELGFAKLWWLAKDESPGCWAIWEEDEVNKAAAKLNEKYASPEPPAAPVAPEVAPEVAPAFSEDYLALLFANKYADKLRYVAAWGQWFIFDGIKWDVDEKLHTFSLSRLICRDAAEEAGGATNIRCQRSEWRRSMAGGNRA
jgi:hypothetical protein